MDIAPDTGGARRAEDEAGAMDIGRCQVDQREMLV
jgi:hypothetical protein